MSANSWFHFSKVHKQKASSAKTREWLWLSQLSRAKVAAMQPWRKGRNLEEESRSVPHRFTPCSNSGISAGKEARMGSSIFQNVLWRLFKMGISNLRFLTIVFLPRMVKTEVVCFPHDRVHYTTVRLVICFNPIHNSMCHCGFCHVYMWGTRHKTNGTWDSCNDLQRQR